MMRCAAENDSNDESFTFQVPKDFGLLIHLHSDSGAVTMASVPDMHYPNIHPNCYAPAEMTNVRLLHGGGSGTAVFGGIHPTLNAIVMKHGGPKDTNEVFSLATITSELALRQSRCKNATAECGDLKRRIPEFVGVYISRHHLRDRGSELWCSLPYLTYTKSGQRLSLMDGNEDNDDILSTNDLYKLSKLHPSSEYPIVPTIRVMQEWHDHCHLTWSIEKGNVDIHIPPRMFDNCHRISAGTDFVREFGLELQKQQEKHNWKVTLMQKWIGGDNAINGADVLTGGNLKGELLETLIQEFTTVMHNLDQLTLPEEKRGCLEVVQCGLEALRVTKDVRIVSKKIDLFVGGSVLKNFHPDHGRFRILRLVGVDMRNDALILTDHERAPAHFLGKLLEKDTAMERVFLDPPNPRVALDEMEDRGWLDILEHATASFTSTSLHAATDCIWTCGLTDAGLHNCFLSVDRGLEMFDLGEPSLEPRPAFLTKFLMSFFHTLGMESNGEGSWKNRFHVVQQDGYEILSLTSETKEKIPYLHCAFNIAMDHFIEKIFHGDEEVRTLILKYVVLQLLSDASFCLRRWEDKGGGAQRYGERSKDRLEKWLWRALWDCYIATYVYANLLLKSERP
jgi:hypothetical protein